MYLAQVRVRSGLTKSWSLVQSGPLEHMRRVAALCALQLPQVTGTQLLLTVGDVVIQHLWISDQGPVFIHPGGWFRSRFVPFTI